MDDYKIIKKYFGEEMAKYCRDKFPTILEHKGYLANLLLKKFHPNHYLLQDILEDDEEDNFIEFINEYNEVLPKRIETTKTVKELLNEAGYNFYECHSEEDIQKFSKYYAHGERLCTFNGGRLRTCLVFFAVKKNIDSIKRENYSNPKRQDEYGTSVISIQFSRNNGNYLSIKNRYNHTVANPDATFSNNLDKIVPGLTAAFEACYDIKINQNYTTELSISNYVVAMDNKFYKYNNEIDNIYYCPDNIIIDEGKVIKLDTSRYLLIDSYIIDFKLKTISHYKYELEDEFPISFGKITKIETINNKKTGLKEIIIYNNNKIAGIIEVDKLNQIINLTNYNLTTINNDFMLSNITLETIKLPNVTRIGNSFLPSNTELHTLYIPKLTSIGDSFLYSNFSLHNLSLPNLEEVGNDFLNNNEDLTSIYVPKLRVIEDLFLYNNCLLKEIDLPSTEIIGDNFLHNNSLIEKVSIPNLKVVGNYFLEWSKFLKTISLPKLTMIGHSFLENDYNLESVYLPNVEIIGNSFVYFNTNLKTLALPKVKKIGSKFLNMNQILEDISLPNIEIIKGSFLYHNLNLKTLTLPNLTKCGEYFLTSNTNLVYLDLPKLKDVDRCFLDYNNSIKYIFLPSVERIGTCFLSRDNNLEKVILPKLKRIDGIFQDGKELLKWFYAPNLTSVYNAAQIIIMNDTKGIYYVPKLIEEIKRNEENEKTNSIKKRLL